MSATGQWTLHYSWGCTGTYLSSPVEFLADGRVVTTWNGQVYTGLWWQKDGTIIVTWDERGKAKYAGVVTGEAASGAMSTFKVGGNGCWYMLRPVAKPKVGRVGTSEERRDDDRSPLGE